MNKTEKKIGKIILQSKICVTSPGENVRALETNNIFKETKAKNLINI